jgi:hypothetical protein
MIHNQHRPDTRHETRDTYKRRHVMQCVHFTAGVDSPCRWRAVFDGRAHPSIRNFFSPPLHLLRVVHGAQRRWPGGLYEKGTETDG